MLFPDYFLSVRATVEAGREDEFNRWYNSEHIPDFVNIFPGCLGASRFKVMDGDGSHQYMALYAFRTAEELKAAIGSPEIKALIHKYDEAIGSFSTRTRTTYTQSIPLREVAPLGLVCCGAVPRSTAHRNLPCGSKADMCSDKRSCPLLPPKPDMCGATRMSALCQ
jgi:hypothetical protein